jgi:hypothetical protein
VNNNRYSAFVAALIVSVSVACMQPAEPTPVSTLVAITPRAEAFRVLGGGTSSTVSPIIRVEVLGQRSMFLSDSWDLEKLVDQKWQTAFSNSGSPVSQIVMPGHPIVFASIIYTRGSTVESPLFQNVAGIYRMHLQMTYSDGAREAIPPSQTYSLPFAVIE